MALSSVVVYHGVLGSPIPVVPVRLADSAPFGLSNPDSGFFHSGPLLPLSFGLGPW